ncbi:MAG: hypothetical protein MK226_15635 [Saprospiraceae bacterium]|jgi:hypothetical protein|nr:hypothetical protein [Saprospiraceae bacterium]
MSIVRHKGKCLSKEELEKYFNGNLPKQQILRVENHLLECELCSTSVEGMAYLSNSHIDYAISGQNKHMPSYIISIIGVILLAIVTYCFYKHYSNSVLHIKKEMIAFEDHIIISIPRGDEQRIITKAYQAFKRKNYQKTLTILQYKDNNEDANAFLLSAYSYLKLNNFAKAKRQTQQLIQRFPMFWQEANMIHAFIHIQEREKGQAGEKLKKIIEEGVDSPIQQQAEKILKLLY